MRKLCPNFDGDDGLETVLEVPVPEEMFASRNGKPRRKNSKRFQLGRALPSTAAGRNTELQLLLGVIGAPLVPVPIPSHHAVAHRIKDDPIEVSMAKYIIQQYVAAVGGEKALDWVSSMYAMGKVKMMASEMLTASGGATAAATAGRSGFRGKRKPAKVFAGEMGGFVLWQKKPELWCLELVVSGCKMSAGSDGKVAWRQTPWHPSHASRGPPRPLRRSLQGLDPRSTANLFSCSVCIGEKVINGEDCFVLRLDVEPSTLRARSSNCVEIIWHTVWGYFSQRTGLLIQLEDCNLLRLKGGPDDSVYWETTMESSIENYKPIEGINIAHAGHTTVSLFRFGDSADEHARTRMEETWNIEEVDFNIRGLSTECFLPPSDLKKDQEQEGCDVLVRNVRPPVSVQAAIKIGTSKVASVESDDSDSDKEELKGRHVKLYRSKSLS